MGLLRDFQERNLSKTERDLEGIKRNNAKDQALLDYFDDGDP